MPIQPKIKPCKGTHADTKGLGCGKETYYRVLGLGKMCGCYSGFLLDTEAGRIRMNKATLKATKTSRNFKQFEKEENRLKKLPHAIKITQIVFNKYIRLRDSHKPCISSNNYWKPDFDAGHLFSTKQYSALRFNEDNCHAQSIGENRYNEGNFEDYLTNVGNRIGEKRLNKLLALAKDTKRTAKKWGIDELQEIRNHYLFKIKELEKNEGQPRG